MNDLTLNIIEEAISNAGKHARANNIWVHLSQDGETFVARVEDDGRGFDLEAVMEDYSRRGSLGMTNMHERAELVNGTLNIESSPESSTCVTLKISLE